MVYFLMYVSAMKY